MEYSSFIVDSTGTGSDFSCLEDAIAQAEPGAVIRIAGAELTIRGKLVINKGSLIPFCRVLPEIE